MTDRPTAYYLVLSPIVVEQMALRPQEILALWLGHPEHTLLALDSTGERVRAAAYVEPGKVSTIVGNLCMDGTILGLTPADVSQLRASA